MRLVLTLFFGILYIHVSHSQVVNGYAKVTALAGATLTLSNVDETADTFEDDEWVVLMQVQDDVIGTTTNSSGFGDIGAIAAAGLYEVRQIDSHTESLGVPATITLKNTPNYTYNTGANNSVQIITFREFGSPDYTTIADMSALDWDGNIGGVIAISVEGVLTLEHSITANTAGFRGGSRSVNLSGPICNPASVTRYRENNNQLGYKGEGIYKSTNVLHNNGRAKILNGGGGGSHHNGGGAGGGNFVTGGIGGNGWNNCTTNPSGGLGGISLSVHIGSDRVYMGGGGGGGQQNNSQSRDGGNGGGIVLVRAEEITSGTCASISIAANGTGPLSSGTNDGGGGGGAGGSVVFWVDTWSIDAGCPLTVSANGGDGSSSLSGGSHAGGGGGSQGVIIFNGPLPTSNITAETINGDPGCGNTSDPCNSLAGDPTGTDNDGIFNNTGNPLPVELLSFSAELQAEEVLIKWITKSERNNDYFEVECSRDNENWNTISIQNGAGNSSTQLNYKTVDYNPNIGMNYYRLKQTDFDGTFTYSKVISIQFQSEKTLLYPNPTNQLIYLVGENINANSLKIYSPLGETLEVEMHFNDLDQITLSISKYPSGVYILYFERNGKNESHRFTVIK